MNVPDRVIYCDTDSVFSSAADLITKLETKVLNTELDKEQKAHITFKTALYVEQAVNDSWNEYAKKYLNVTDHKFVIKQEYVAESAIWLRVKKRYAQKMISEKGVPISTITKGTSEWKLDVKGLDMVRSNFPKSFRAFMKEFVIDILNMVTKIEMDAKILAFKKDMRTRPKLDVMSPTSVKNISKWEDLIPSTVAPFSFYASGTPAHVKAAIRHNEVLKYKSLDKEYGLIKDRDKIKWTYLKPNPYKIDTIALKGYEDAPIIEEIVEKYIDYDKIFEASLSKKILTFYDVLGWGGLPSENSVMSIFM